MIAKSNKALQEGVEMKPPKTLKKEGLALWKQLVSEWDLTDSEPLLSELCHTCDRLAEVRAILAKDGLMVDGARHPLSEAEIKLANLFRQVYRQLDLREEPAKPGRPGPKPRVV
jgi:hypothetical protein